MTGHSPLNVGAAVQPGTIIGYVGITGNATGYHLHFEVMRTSTGSNVNPAAFMRQHGVNIGC
jgi:murein DD-endopeptidase MepM/ murein hydrolase activator NlpD